MESKKDEMIAGHDFFKKLREASTKDLPLPPIPIETSDQLITRTKITQSIKSRSEVVTSDRKVDSGVSDEPPSDEAGDCEATLTGNHSDGEARVSSCYCLDDDSSNDEIDELELQQLKDYRKLSYPKRG